MSPSKPRHHHRSLPKGKEAFLLVFLLVLATTSSQTGWSPWPAKLCSGLPAWVWAQERAERSPIRCAFATCSGISFSMNRALKAQMLPMAQRKAVGEWNRNNRKRGGRKTLTLWITLCQKLTKAFSKDFFTFIYACISMYAYMCAGACGVQKRALDPLRAEVTGSRELSTWVLGPTFQSSTRVVHTLNHWAPGASS